MAIEWKAYQTEQELPQDVIKGGKDANGKDVYIARAQVKVDGNDEGLQPGRFDQTAAVGTGRGAIVGFAGKEMHFSKCELLCGDQNMVKWLDMTGPLPPNYVELNLVEGGSDKEGNPLFIAKVTIDGADYIGRTGPALKGATVAVDGREVNHSLAYKILAHN